MSFHLAQINIGSSKVNRLLQTSKVTSGTLDRPHAWFDQSNTELQQNYNLILSYKTADKFFIIRMRVV